MLHPVDERVGGLKASDFREIGMNEKGRQAVFVQGQGTGSIHLNVTESLIAEFRCVIDPVLTQIKAIGLEGFEPPIATIVAVDIGLVYQAVFKNPFAIPEGYACTDLAADMSSDIAG